MKVKIKSYNGELPEYLTDGKEYIVDSLSKTGCLFRMFSDDGKLDSFLFDGCGHLNGGSWEVVE